jgi:hypothetical protein
MPRVILLPIALACIAYFGPSLKLSRCYFSGVVNIPWTKISHRFGEITESDGLDFATGEDLLDVNSSIVGVACFIQFTIGVP